MAQSNNMGGGKSGGVRVADDDHYVAPSSSTSEDARALREVQVRAAIKRSKDQGWSELVEREPVVRNYKPPALSAAQVEAAIKKSKEQGWSELAERGPIVRDHKPPTQTQAQVAAAIKRSKEQGWSELAEREPIVTTSSLRARASWEELKRTNSTFVDVGQDMLKLGDVVGEEGKAKIYEAFLGHENSSKVVAKVLRVDGFLLADFQGHWTTKKMTFGSESFKDYNQLHLGTFMKDGKFAIVIPRFWGDLRKLINAKMSEKDFQGPPFSFPQALWVMSRIAIRMRDFHTKMRDFHQDLKASNVLFFDFGGAFGNHFSVEGSQMSLGLVQGTGLWKAPEVLDLNLSKNRNGRETWTQEMDIYSFGMTCYEVLTGNIPFFGYDERDWKRVIDGERPHLPFYIDPKAQDIVDRCWHKEPKKRPTFDEILLELENMMKPFNKDEFIIGVPL